MLIFLHKVYTIEFQKRGLLHAHILLFLEPSKKPNDPSSIDKIISAEIQDKDADPELHELVSNIMMYGPCVQNKDLAKCI